MVETQEPELDEGFQLLSSTLERLETEEDNKEALLEWVIGVCDPEFGMVEGLVANFIDFIDNRDYARTILKILV
jgi:hypothetical protein